MTGPGVFEIRDKDLAGRIGRLHTPHGVLETPALLPVIDVARQELPLEEIAAAGFRAVITNAYLLWKRMRSLAEKRGVHGILGFDGIIMTDSGAYQILEYGDVEITPREVIEFQKRIGSDIAVILDVPTGNRRSRSQAEHSVEETLRRARAALEDIDPDRRVWVLPIQGGPYSDLVARSAREATKLLGPYRLLALGSPTVLLERYDYATLLEMIYTARLNTPWSVPLHLFGAGHPMIIPYAVALGVDMFDSASYILYARDNRYITETRTYRLEELQYFPCSCPVCSRYTPQELLEMPRDQRVRLLALHNLYMLRKMIDKTRQAIREGRLWELLEEMSRGHPTLARAFHQLATRYTSYLKLHTPRVKAHAAKGLLLSSPESAGHPRLLIHHESLVTRYRRPPSLEKAILIPVTDKPFTHSEIYRSIAGKPGKNRESHVVGYQLYIGAIPEELAETYPLSQHETPSIPYTETVEATAERIADYITSQGYREAVIYHLGPDHWSYSVAARVEKLLRSRGIKAEAAELPPRNGPSPKS